MKYRSLLSVALIACYSQMAMAQPQVAFTTYRIALDDNNRQQSLTLRNKSNIAARCEVGFTEKKVQPNGELVNVESAAEVANPASPMVRFSPSRVTIPPAGSQTVRISLKRTKSPGEGEFVSFLRLSCRDDVTEGQNGQINLQPRISYNLPLVVHLGPVSATASLSAAKLDGQKLTFNINREGNRSLYTNVEVIDKSTEKVIGSLKQISVYWPTKTQQIAINLDAMPQGAVEIRLSEPVFGKEGAKASLNVAR